MLRKVDYPYEYMDDREKFHAKSLSEEKDIENNMQKLKINIWKIMPQNVACQKSCL